MSTTPYLKLALGQYVDSTTTQTNTLTYAIGAVGPLLTMQYQLYQEHK